MATLNAAHEHVVQGQPQPSELALGRTVLRFVLTLRCGGVVTAGAVSGIGGSDGISPSWPLLEFAGLAGWAMAFSIVAVRRGLTAAPVTLRV
jgi:hypothetical protein